MTMNIKCHCSMTLGRTSCAKFIFRESSFCGRKFSASKYFYTNFGYFRGISDIYIFFFKKVTLETLINTAKYSYFYYVQKNNDFSTLVNTLLLFH